MRVCILSMQRVPNYGSLLQGYSLKTMIESLGHEVEFIDIEENKEDDSMMEGHRRSFKEEYGIKKGIAGKLSKFDRYFLNRVRQKSVCRSQMAVMETFQKEIISLRPENNQKHYDYCVIGSDEVFNALNPAEWGFTGQLFGDVKQADHVITYAASCGFTTAEELPTKAKQRISETMGNLEQISVRDSNTEHFVKALTGRTAEVNLDPVVVGDFSEESRREEPLAGLPSRYCIVYAYRNRIYKKEEIRAIKKLCREKNMEPITVGSPQMWIKKHVAVTPFQISKIFEGAQFVVTDTFHGTIFAAKYAKRLAVLVRPSNRNKLGDLIEKLHIEKHRADDIGELSRIYEQQHDLSAMKELSRREREKSLDYLRQALK